jgi:hypothetical protein
VSSTSTPQSLFSSEQSNRRIEVFQAVFDEFNEAFAATARREGFEFDPRSGPGICRALRLREGQISKGVFLEMQKHWAKSDASDPGVTLTFGAWYYPSGKMRGAAFHLLVKTFYEGKLSKLDNISALLQEAASQVKAVTKDVIVRDGKLVQTIEL